MRGMTEQHNMKKIFCLSKLGVLNLALGCLGTKYGLNMGGMLFRDCLFRLVP